jgi:hypothetical protein
LHKTPSVLPYEAGQLTAIHNSSECERDVMQSRHKRGLIAAVALGANQLLACGHPCPASAVRPGQRLDTAFVEPAGPTVWLRARFN